MVYLLVIFALLSFVAAQAPGETCSIHQYCQRNHGELPTDPCPDPNQILNPPIVWSTPKVLSSSDQSDLDKICPFMNVTAPLCCESDQVAIMSVSYQQIDSVFGEDVSLCAVNLKKLWCEYACGPNQYQFVKGLGYEEITIAGTPTNFTEVVFTVNEDMGCTLFKSCNKVSMIAQASIQSSIAFLDFMGVNGQNQSISVITFDLKEGDSPGDFESRCQKKDGQKSTGQPMNLNFNPNALAASEKAVQTDEVQYDSAYGIPLDYINEEERPVRDVPQIPLNVPLHDCEMIVPADGIVDGYTKVKNSTCTFCSAICEPPQIDASIGFFDGFHGKTVGIVYGVLFAFVILWQVFQCFYTKPRTEKEYAMMEEQQKNGQRYSDINKTGSSNEINLYK